MFRTSGHVFLAGLRQYTLDPDVSFLYRVVFYRLVNSMAVSDLSSRNSVPRFIHLATTSRLALRVSKVAVTLMLKFYFISLSINPLGPLESALSQQLMRTSLSDDRTGVRMTWTLLANLACALNDFASY